MKKKKKKDGGRGNLCDRKEKVVSFSIVFTCLLVNWVFIGIFMLTVNSDISLFLLVFLFVFFSIF